jgi:hypothetical protein
MQYLLLIYGNENQFQNLEETEQGKVFNEYMVLPASSTRFATA